MAVIKKAIATATTAITTIARVALWDGWERTTAELIEVPIPDVGPVSSVVMLVDIGSRCPISIWTSIHDAYIDITNGYEASRIYDPKTMYEMYGLETDDISFLADGRHFVDFDSIPATEDEEKALERAFIVDPIRLSALADLAMDDEVSIREMAECPMTPDEYKAKHGAILADLTTKAEAELAVWEMHRDFEADLAEWEAKQDADTDIYTTIEDAHGGDMDATTDFILENTTDTNDKDGNDQ